jgi:uncharacterized protein
MAGMVMVLGIGVLVLLLYAVLATVVAHCFTTPRRIQSATHDRSRYERVQFCARGESLNLIASYRRTPAATGAVILVHGRDACRGEELRGTTRSLVVELASRGLSVLMIDLRGHGESDRARLTFGRRERRDILGAVDFLLNRGYLPGRIGVFGASMGGVGAIAAAAEEQAIGALITDSAFASLDEVLAAQFTRVTRLPSLMLAGALLAAHALTGEDLLRHVPTHNMRRLRGRPSLVIHSEHDPFVPVQHARDLAMAGACDTWITPGTRHLSSYSMTGQAYLDQVGVFFARHLCTAATPPVADTQEMAEVA